MNKYLGQWKIEKPAPTVQIPQQNGDILTSKHLHLPRPKAVQTALYMGRQTFNRKHPDFAGLFLLNNLFGGYFGSRLMENIREDKGYTYGIYSSLDTNHFDGCMHIGAEVDPENFKATLEEVWHEMTKLRENPVSADEFNMLRNYTLGSLMAMVDGPFNIAGIVKTIVNNELPFDFFDRLVAAVQDSHPQQLQDLAQRYLKPEDWIIVEVGP